MPWTGTEAIFWRVGSLFYVPDKTLAKKRIRELRAMRGWSQERLAEEADLHRTYIGGIERSLRNVSLFNIAKLAHAFGVPIAQLFTTSAKVRRRL
jgi:transcriptional regulator with XRE-family HTH domain